MLTFLFLSFAALCVARVPIAFAMLVSSTLTIWLQGDVPLIIVPQRLWAGLNNFPLLAVPFFLFVGQQMNAAGISDRLVDFSRAIVGHLRGGLAHVNVVVSMIFAGISGVSFHWPIYTWPRDDYIDKAARLHRYAKHCGQVRLGVNDEVKGLGVRLSVRFRLRTACYAVTSRALPTLCPTLRRHA